MTPASRRPIAAIEIRLAFCANTVTVALTDGKEEHVEEDGLQW
jgi:hypothetical protein